MRGLPSTLQKFRFQKALGGFVADGDAYTVLVPFSDVVERDRIAELTGLHLPKGVGEFCGEPMSVRMTRHHFLLWVADLNPHADGTMYLSYDAGIEAYARAARVEEALGELKIPMRVVESAQVQPARRPVLKEAFIALGEDEPFSIEGDRVWAFDLEADAKRACGVDLTAHGLHFHEGVVASRRAEFVMDHPDLANAGFLVGPVQVRLLD